MEAPGVFEIRRPKFDKYLRFLDEDYPSKMIKSYLWLLVGRKRVIQYVIWLKI